MSRVDLTAFQDNSEGTTLEMPDGTEITLKPMMALGPEHDGLIMELIGAVSELHTSGGEDSAIPMRQVTKLMPVASKLIAAAAPNKSAANKLDRLPLMARFQVLMAYIADSQLGEATPSED